jgi:hypothetical protein
MGQGGLLWGSFLSLTLFHPMTEAMVEATLGLGFPPNRNHALAVKQDVVPESNGGESSSQVPAMATFKRDVGALMKPNGSAILPRRFVLKMLRQPSSS